MGSDGTAGTREGLRVWHSDDDKSARRAAPIGAERPVWRLPGELSVEWHPS